jgi:peptidoglycan hydrolase-like protein with peptidoglycan-binding domain
MRIVAHSGMVGRPGYPEKRVVDERKIDTVKRHALRVAVLASLMLVMAPAPSAAISRAQFPTQSLGSRGSDVAALQHLLRSQGVSIAVSGYFDAATRAAVADFQNGNGLKADGVARPPTWQALVPTLERGARGEAVLALKRQLNDKRDAGLAAGELYDAPTVQAVRAFQRRMGLPTTGAADRATWRHLLWSFAPVPSEGAVCDYSLHGGPSRQWGTASTVAQLAAAGELYQRRTGQRLAVGDISLERGGSLAGHRTHRVGLDVDVRPARTRGSSCRAGISYRMRSYDRQGTRELIQAIHDAAPGHVKLIYFNDPQLIREGLTLRYPNHDAHLHIRYCEADHPLAAYRCPNSATHAAEGLADPLDRGSSAVWVRTLRVLADDFRSVHGGLLQELSKGPVLSPARTWFGRCSASGCTWAH